MFNVMHWMEKAQKLAEEKHARLIGVTYHPVRPDTQSPYMPISGGEIYAHLVDFPGGVIGSGPAIQLIGKEPISE